MYKYRVRIIMPRDFSYTKVVEKLQQGMGLKRVTGRSIFRVCAESGRSEQIWRYKMTLERDATLAVAIGDPGELCVTVRSVSKEPIFEVLWCLGIPSDKLAVCMLEEKQEGMDG